jgi:hypothetical protein
MAALMSVESFHIEKLREGTQIQDCSRFSVRQMQHGHNLLPPALFSMSVARRLRWSSGSHAGLWFPSSRVQTRPKPLDYFCVKKSSACLPSEGKLNNVSHVPTLRHVKEPISCGVLRADSEIPSTKKFPPPLAEGSRAAWRDGASGDE